MKWFSVKDVVAGYSIPKWQLQSWCRDGTIGAMKIPDERWKRGSYQYLIPEGELYKLSEYKTGEPLYKEEHQPSEYLTLRNQVHEVKEIAERWGNYEEYLRTHHWQEVREQALMRDGFTCRMCGTGKNLRVHHVRYENLGKDAELEDVVTLCDECHSKVHTKDNEKGD